MDPSVKKRERFSDGAAVFQAYENGILNLSIYLSMFLCKVFGIISRTRPRRATNVVPNWWPLRQTLLRHSVFNVQWLQSERHMIFAQFYTTLPANVRFSITNGSASLEIPFSRQIILRHFDILIQLCDKRSLLLQGRIRHFRHSFWNERLRRLIYLWLMILILLKSPGLKENM